MDVDQWFAAMGEAIVVEIDRLWPDEDDPGYRAGSLAEEAAEVLRATTKRRHAENAVDGLCKGKTVDQWSEELRVELVQSLGVIFDIAYREDINLVSGLEECLAILQVRKRGT